MYAFLVILGAIVALAGVLIAAPGLPLPGRDFDPSIITPGAVAVVGGLILVGLGLTVRVLSRIEKALAAGQVASLVTSPVPNPVVREEPVVALAGTVEVPASAPAPLPSPRKRAGEAPSQPMSAEAATASGADAGLNSLHEQFPILTPPENAPVVELADASLQPPPAHVDQEAVEVNNTVVNGRAQTNAVPSKMAPRRLDLHVRPASRPEPSRSFDAFWPKGQRPGQGATPAIRAVPAVPPPAAPQPVAQALPVEPVLPAEPTQFQFHAPAPEPTPPMAAAPEAPTPISILKSGVVNGMAYTLYSDGSIEAQLPQGTLRFGSITELRNHIEQSA